MAELVFRSNLVGDGTVVAGKPFTDAVKDAQMPFLVDGEVVPNREDTRCIDASSIGPAYGNIPSGSTSEHVITIGPIDESLVDSVVVARGPSWNPASTYRLSSRLRTVRESWEKFRAFSTRDSRPSANRSANAPEETGGYAFQGFW